MMGGTFGMVLIVSDVAEQVFQLVLGPPPWRLMLSHRLQKFALHSTQGAFEPRHMVDTASRFHQDTLSSEVRVREGLQR